MRPRGIYLFLSTATVIAIWVLASTLVGSIHYLRPGPGFDFWTGAMPFLQSAVDGPWRWSLLWEPYAGAHHLVLSRLLFLLEWIFGGFRNFWLLGFAWGALFASAWIIMAAVWAEKTFDSTSHWICVLLIVLGFASAHHLNNLAYAFNQQWTTGLLFSLLGIKGVIGSCTSKDNVKRFGYGALALVSAILLASTTFCLPAIILAWLTLCWSLSIRRPITVFVLIALLIIFWLDVSGLSLLNTLNHDTKIENPALFFIQIIFFMTLGILRYLGSPLAEYSTAAGAALATAALVVFLIAARNQKQGTTVNPLLVLAIAYAAFVIGMALSTAIGRIEWQHAINPRFRSLNLPFLTIAAILFVSQIQGYEIKKRGWWSTVLLTLALAVVLPGQVQQFYKFSEEYDLVVPGSIAFASGLTDKDAVHESRFAKFQVVDNQNMLAYRDFLKKHHKAIYATNYYEQIGSNINLDNRDSDLTTGTLTALNGGGYRWRGVTEICGADGRIAITDTSGHIIGSGMVNRKLPDLNWKIIYQIFMPYCRKDYAATWTAFIPANIANEQTVYAAVFDEQPKLIARNTTHAITQ